MIRRSNPLLWLLCMFSIACAILRVHSVVQGFGVERPVRIPRVIRPTFVADVSRQSPLLMTKDSLESTEPNLEPKSLGIDIGHRFTDDDLASIKKACEEMIESTVAAGLVDLQDLHDQFQRDVLYRQELLERTMRLGAIQETKRFETKLDLLVGNFLNQTLASRQRTHSLAKEVEEEEKAKEKQELEREAKKGKVQLQPWTKTNNEWDTWDDWDSW